MKNKLPDQAALAEGAQAPDLLDSLDKLESVLATVSPGNEALSAQAHELLYRIRTDAQRLANNQMQLATLCEIGREAASILALDDLLTSILDQAIRLVQAERGLLVLCRDGSEDDFDIPLVRGMDRSAVEATDDRAVSQKLIRHVLRRRCPLITTDAQSDARFDTSASVVALQIRSVLAVPLIFQQDLIGAIYLDTRMTARTFAAEDLNLLNAMANQVAVAIHIAQLYTDLEAKNRELATMVQELRETQEELVRRERLSAIGQMSSTIIHDIKNPMASVKGFAQLLGKPDLTDEQRKRFSEFAVQAIDSFIGMTQEILDYARGEQTLNVERFDVSEFLVSLRDFVSRDCAGYEIDVELEPGYGGELVGDRQKLWRAFYNIARNAAEAMEGSEKRRVLTIASQRSDSGVVFTLSDTGSGIAPALKEHMFKPFATFGKRYGTGLGLSIAKSIIEAHGGQISCVSELGRGSTFTVSLPVTGDTLHE